DPVSVEAESAENNKESFPRWSVIRYQFPARGKRPALALTWYDGGKRPDPAKIKGLPADALKVKTKKGTEPASSGSLLVGAKGFLFAPGDTGGGYRLIGDVDEVKVESPPSPGHFAEFVRAIRGGPAPMSNFTTYAGPLTETVLLGNLAVWAGKKVE